MVWLLLAVALLISCGGSSQRSELVLRFSQVVDAPYFSAVEVYVLGRDFEPIRLRKEGRFLPGDRVSFDVNIPEGKERGVEAVVYDPAGSPVYYGVRVVDVPAQGDIVVELRATHGTLSSREVFSDTSLRVGGVPFFLMSGDLSLVYREGKSTEDGTEEYLSGSYLAYSPAEGRFRFLYLRDKKEVSLEVSRNYEFEVVLPAGEQSLILSGSYEGRVSAGQKVVIPSERLLAGGIAVVSAQDGALYLNPGGGSPLGFPMVGCFAGDPNCLPLGISISPSVAERYEVYAQRGGIRVRMDLGRSFWKVAGFDYYIRLLGRVQGGGCVGTWELWFPVGADFEGKAELLLSLWELRLPLDAPAQVRVSSASLSAELACENDALLRLPYVYSEEANVEVLYGDGKLKGAKATAGQTKELKLPKEEIGSFKVEEEKEHLVLSLARPQSFGDCSVELVSDRLSLSVELILPERSYLRIKKLWKELVADVWKAKVVCFSKDRKSYIGLENLPYKASSLF